MNCPECNSTKINKNGKDRAGVQKYVCTDCGYNYTDLSKGRTYSTPVSKTKIGITLDEFRRKYDVDYIVEQTMAKLDKNTIYEKGDIYKMTGLSPSYSGLSAAIDNCTDHHGKAGGKVLFSHPETIKTLKENAKMT